MKYSDFKKGDWVFRSYTYGTIIHDVFRLTHVCDQFPKCDLFRCISEENSKIYKRYQILIPSNSRSLRHATLEEILLVDPTYKPITTQIVYEVY